jgi:hypothetical protein
MQIPKREYEAVNRRKTDNSITTTRKCYKATNNNLQNTTKKINYRATRIPLKPEINSGAPR